MRTATLLNLPAGTQVLSIQGERGDTVAGRDISTGAYATGVISQALSQEHCYAVDFPSGVSVFLSPVELSDRTHYQVIRRVIAHFQPQAWIKGYALDVDGDCDIDVTDRLLQMSLADIHDLDDDNYQSDELVYGMTDHVGPHYVTVKDSVLEFFGVDTMIDITEDMLVEKRLEYAPQPSSPNGKLHNVHIYAVVRVEVRNVEAENHPEAIKKAEEKAGLHHRLTRGNDQEYAEDIDCFLVDEHGDEGFANSCWYGKDGLTPLQKNNGNPLELHPTVVTIIESKDNNSTLIFECQAEDISHAIEQAKNAYPNGNIVAAMLKDQ
ncbi:MAG: hypothetical protein ABL933_16965 [Methyloglobulus sp.]